MGVVFRGHHVGPPPKRAVKGERPDRRAEASKNAAGPENWGTQKVLKSTIANSNFFAGESAGSVEQGEENSVARSNDFAARISAANIGER